MGAAIHRVRGKEGDNKQVRRVGEVWRRGEGEGVELSIISQRSWGYSLSAREGRENRTH